MIDFKEGFKSYVAVNDATKRQLKEKTEKIDEYRNQIKIDKYFLGVHLCELYRSKVFAARYWGDCSSKKFFEYCELYFDMSKTTVCNYMNVVDEFGDGARGLKDPWKGYSWSLLVEMLPLTPELRAKVPSDWTVREIQNWKKELVPTSGLTDKEFDILDRIINKEPPEPERWRKCSRSQLIGYIEKQDRYRDYLVKILRENKIEYKIMECGGWESEEEETVIETEDDSDEWDGWTEEEKQAWIAENVETIA